MPKQKRIRKAAVKKPPYSLYRVLRSEENKHAGIVFIYTASRQVFAADGNCYQDKGDLLLAGWGSDGKLETLYEAKELRGNEVLLGRCLKSRNPNALVNKVALSSVEDLRE